MVNEIQGQAYNALLHKLMSMKEGAPAPSLAPELLAGIVLEADRVEWGFLKGEHSAVGCGIPAAAAGNLCFAQITNPSGSGALLVIEQIHVSATAGQSVFFQVQTSGAIANETADLARTHRDTRAITGTASSGLVATASTGNSLVSLRTTTHFEVKSPASLTTVFPCPLVLSPGFRLLAEAAIGNTTFTISWFWRERVLEPSETR